MSIGIISSDFEGNAEFGERKKWVSKTRREKQRQGVIVRAGTVAAGDCVLRIQRFRGKKKPSQICSESGYK